MTYKFVSQSIDGRLTAAIGSAATVVPVDAETLGVLDTEVNFTLGQWTYLTLTNAVYSEEVKVTGVAPGYAVVTRAQAGSIARAFLVEDTTITTRLNSAAVADIVTATVSPFEVTVSGTGQAEVTSSDNNYNVHVEVPTIEGQDGVQILGDWPSIIVALEEGTCGCCSSGTGGGPSGSGITEVVIVSDILQGEVTDGVLTLALVEPEFTGEDGVEVTGEWPNYTIGLPGGGGGGGGTVLSVAVGSGLTLLGNPNVNPTILLSNTGITPGTYGGVVINAQGQIEDVPVGFNPVSDVTVDHASAVRTGGTIALTLNVADVGTPGVVELADPSAPLDAGDTESAVTPASVVAALAAMDTLTAGSSTGEADGLYTNALAITQLTVNIAAGEKLILMGSVVVLDDVAPATPVEYGLAIFNTSGAALWKQKKATQSQQTVLGVVNGPLTGVIGLVTTTLTGATVQSAYLIGMKE